MRNDPNDDGVPARPNVPGDGTTNSTERRGRRAALATLVTGALALGAGAVVLFSHHSGQPVAGSDPAVASAASATPSGSAPVSLVPAQLPVHHLDPATPGTRTPTASGAPGSTAPVATAQASVPGAPGTAGTSDAGSAAPAPATAGAATGAATPTGAASTSAGSAGGIEQPPASASPPAARWSGIRALAGDSGLPTAANMAVCRQMSAVLASHVDGTLQNQTCRASTSGTRPANDLVELQAQVVGAAGMGHVTLSTAGNSTMASGVRATASTMNPGVADPRAMALVGDGHAVAHAWQYVVVTNMDQEKGTVYSAEPPLTRAGVVSLLEDAAWPTIDAAWLHANPQD